MKMRDESQAKHACLTARTLDAEGIDPEEIARRLNTYGRVVKIWLGRDESGFTYDEIIGLRNRGMPISEIASTTGISRNYIRQAIGSMPRRSDTVVRQVRVNRRTWERLPAICDDLGVRKVAQDARPSGSIARLLDGIADGHLIVEWKPGSSPDTVNLGID